MKGFPIKYTTEQEEFLIVHRSMQRKKLTKLFNKKFDVKISVVNIKTKCLRMGLKAKNNGCFKKKNIPHNKGKKMPIDIINKTEFHFKKGHIPKNWRPIGSERTNKDGYIEIKTEEGLNKYRLKHRVIWEKENGPIPKGMIIRFKYNDKNNVDISNLEMVSTHENLLLNKSGYAQEREEIKPVLKTLVKLELVSHKVNKSGPQV